MDDKLKSYELLYKAYADEIKNLWKRSIFLGTFMVLVWTGYGALQLKFIEKCADNAPFSYHLVSLGLCAVIIVLSLLWVAMAKGSKFVQEAHERHIQRYMRKQKCRLFCNLNTYEKILNKNMCGDLVFCGTLKACRYSPSKINIALGWLSLFVSACLAVIHIYSFWDKIKTKIPFLKNVLDIITMTTNFPFNNFILVSIVIAVLIFTLLISFVIYITLKGNRQSFLCRLLCILFKPFFWTFNRIVKVTIWLKRLPRFFKEFLHKLNPKNLLHKIFKEKDKNTHKSSIISKIKNKFSIWYQKFKKPKQGA